MYRIKSGVSPSQAPKNLGGIPDYASGRRWRSINAEAAIQILGQQLGVPVGPRELPVYLPGIIVPEVAPATDTGPTAADVLVSTAGENKTQNTTELPGLIQAPLVIAEDWFDYHKNKGLNPNLKPPNWKPPGNVTVATTRSPIGTPGTTNLPTITGTPTKTGGSMDLGDILGTVTKGVIDYQIAKASQPTVVQAPVPTTPAFNPLSGGVLDFFTDDTGNVVAVKKPCKRRRRRRRLATKSDLGDLAALKAILGNGEAFKAWIATHSR